MTDASPDDRERLAGYVATWQRACADLVALTRSLSEEQGDLPTDLAGWSVRDNIAHTAHLEAVLAGAPEEEVEVAEAAHLTAVTALYTEQGVIARRERTLAELADEIEQAVASRSAALAADPPDDGDAPPPRTPGGVPWTTEVLLRNRPLDVWMHEQDVRRAVGRAGGWDSPAAAHTLRIFAGSLPVLVGKRVAPPPGTVVRLRVPEAGIDRTVEVGADGRAGRADGSAEPTTTVTLTPEAFVILSGGRRDPGEVDATITGDEDLGRRLLGVMAVTP
ncbi:MAG: maleylpyruvate isomerase family mycothiol-dependent enzyme [Marmoricola sp.]